MSHRTKVILWRWALAIYIAAVTTSAVLQYVVGR